MKRDVFLSLLTLVLLILPNLSLAQTVTPTPNPPTATATPELPQRMTDLEAKIEGLEQERDFIRQDSDRFANQAQNTFNILNLIFYALAGIAGVTVLFQFIQGNQQTKQHNLQVERLQEREKQIEEQQKERDKRVEERERRQEELVTRIADAQVDSTQRVAAVLGTVDNLLKQATSQVNVYQSVVEDLQTEIRALTTFKDSIEKGIKLQMSDIKKTADDLVEVPRHNFKHGVDNRKLNDFAQRFDAFRSQYPGEVTKFSGKVWYIRGIAAAFNNEFEHINECLTEVVRLEAEDNEPPVSWQHRLANSYYFWGLNHANLGETSKAIDYFELAQKTHPRKKDDFLTLIVMAEAYVMNGDYDKAKNECLQKIEQGLNDLKNTNKRLENHQKKLLSRTFLIRANIDLIEKEIDEALTHAKAANREAPDYYYATFTLAQLLQYQKDETAALEKYEKAYTQLQQSGDLYTITETRTRILVNMAAALCSKQGKIESDAKIDSYLDEAENLRKQLPSINGRTSTVYSLLSKRNEDSATIEKHITALREGAYLHASGEFWRSD